MTSEKPVSLVKCNTQRQEPRFSWISRAIPAFHCILIGIAFALAAFRFFVTDANDSYKCNAMLNDGQWLDEGQSSPEALKNWQPDGCMLHRYDHDTATTCLSGRTLVFSGDSIVRNLYFAAIKVLDPEYDIVKLAAEGTHRDFNVSLSGIDLHFTWDRFLDTRRTIDILERRDITQQEGHRPAMVVMGTGLHELSSFKADAPEKYIEAIDRIIEATGPKSRNRPQIADEFILIPVEHTYTPKLRPDKAVKLTNPRIDNLNVELRKRAPPYTSRELSDLSVLYALNQMVDSPVAINHTTDGLHYDESVTSTVINMTLNLRCNDVMPKKFPFGKTCCMQYPAPNWMQAVLLLFSLIWAPLGLHYYASNGRQTHQRVFPPHHVLAPMAIFGFSCVFMYFTDRTSLYLKIQKQFDSWQFAIAVIIVAIVGLATTRRSEEDLGFLNRDQTDEWKGWMQAAVLIYHYYGASQISSIYNPIRVLVAAYLFMSGYGHFSFYYKKADFGLARVAGVLVRLNLLTLALAYIQDTDYLSYYFSPLVTLWFGIIWVTMYIGYNHNKNLPFMLAKIVASAALTSAFHLYAKPLQLLFGVFNTIFNTEWNATEWNFRVTLDMYIVYIGMLAALAVIKIQENKTCERVWWRWVNMLSCLASVLGLAGYFAFELQNDKLTYNQYHPYISFVPILSFVILRNATAFLRSTSSRAFIWLGQCSLETFICQFHLWLAGDTKGLLVLLPWPRLRLLNMLFTTLVFLFVSNQIAISTGELTDWMCGKQAKKQAVFLPSSTLDPEGVQYVPLANMDAGSTTIDGLPVEVAPIPSKMDKLFANLKFRCAFIMGLIWIVNLLYPSYYPSSGHLLPTH